MLPEQLRTLPSLIRCGKEHFSITPPLHHSVSPPPRGSQASRRASPAKLRTSRVKGATVAVAGAKRNWRSALQDASRSGCASELPTGLGVRARERRFSARALPTRTRAKQTYRGWIREKPGGWRGRPERGRRASWWLGRRDSANSCGNWRWILVQHCRHRAKYFQRPQCFRLNASSMTMRRA